MHSTTTASVSAPAPTPGAPTIGSTLRFLIQVSRPGLWLTAVWFYLLPLGGQHLFRSFNFWLGVVYVAFPLGMLLYGWNDCVDYEADRLNPRKGTYLFGGRGSAAQLRRLPAQIALVQLPFAVAFVLLAGWRMLGFFGAMAAACAIYNGIGGHAGWKGRPPLEVLNQAGYLLVFVLSSWLNHLPQLPWQAMVFGAMFAMHSHVFGEIMDIAPDRAAGRSTTATRLGAVAGKWIIVGFLAVESGLIYFSFYDLYLAGFLALSALWFVADAVILWRDRLYSPREMRWFLLGWNAVALGSMYWVWSAATLLRPH